MRTVAMVLFGVVPGLLMACGGGADDTRDVGGMVDESTAQESGTPASGSPAPVPVTRQGEVAELHYSITGAVSEDHVEEHSLICSTTPDGTFLAQNFGSDWSLNLSVAGTGPGTHEASLQLGPPDRAGLRDGDDWRRGFGGSASGPVTLLETGERDGYGNDVMELDFSFPTVTLERSEKVVGAEGTFRCGVLRQD